MKGRLPAGHPKQWELLREDRQLHPTPATAATSPVPPANPPPAATARINDDDLSLHRQVIDLSVSSLGYGQRHGIRDIRRDSPADRSDAGNGNDGTRQDIREHRTATHCIHEFSPLSECFLDRCGNRSTVELAWRTTTNSNVRLVSRAARPAHI
jgi:hypothetical protein